jgi:hypothetical protein
VVGCLLGAEELDGLECNQRAQLSVFPFFILFFLFPFHLNLKFEFESCYEFPLSQLYKLKP